MHWPRGSSDELGKNSEEGSAAGTLQTGRNSWSGGSRDQISQGLKGHRKSFGFYFKELGNHGKS